MSSQAADHAERAQALNLAESFIVQAPAGSGKTELLIQRYLALLAHVENPEEVVAITFTNKSAAEMRGRIGRALAEARSGGAPEMEHDRKTRQLAQAVLAQDQRQQWRLALNPGRLRIQTVDSFCASLTRQMPLLSRLGAQPDTVEDPEPLYREAAARMLAQLEEGSQWSDNVAALLTYLDNDLPRVRDLLAAMLRQRDQWMRHITRGVRREDLEGALRRLVESSLAGLRREIPAECASELIELLEYAAGNLTRDDRPSAIRACAGLTLLPAGAGTELPCWLGIVELLLTQNRHWRKTVDARQGFPPGAMKDRMRALLGRLSGNEVLLGRLMEVRYLPPVTYDEREWEIAQALSALLILADAQLRVVFGEQNQIDFMGIAMAAIEALEEEGAPTDLALHLDYRIRHLLIDEFQDISINQYLLLRRLTAGWNAVDGHTLFLVGDPMQSIYRFREAEVGKFLDTWQEQRLGQVPLTPIRIRVNFRSRAGIVHWVNDAFARVLPAVPDIARGAVNYAPAEPFHGAEAEDAVVVHAQRERDDGVEARKILDLIRSARAADPDGTIAILVRTRSRLHAIVPGLRQAGLRFRAVDIDPLATRPAIQDLLALTRALQHRADRVAWFAVLRAPWCGLTLADLMILVFGGGPRTLWECLSDETLCARLEDAAQQRVLRVRTAFAAAFVRQGRLPMHRQVEALWLALGGPATVADAANLENARAFFELLATHEEGGEIRDLVQFSAAVEQLYAAPDVDADGTLQIMTMHKAKGLEFDTVILPGLGRGKRRDDPALMLWDERAREDGGEDLLLAPIKEAGADDAPLYKCLQYFEKERQDYEEGRLLYVAATRARRRLHLLGHVREGKDGDVNDPPRDSLLRHLWPVVRGAFESAPAQRAESGSAAQAQAGPGEGMLRRLPARWVLPPAPPRTHWQPRFRDEETGPELEFEWASQTLMHVGTIYHRTVQLIAEQGLQHWDAARVQGRRDVFAAMLRQLGVPQGELNWALDQVQQALVNTLEHERGRWILSAEHTDARNEYALTGMYGGRPVSAVIDRTFVDADGTRWVIDYKTSRHEGRDRDAFLARELQRYAEPLARYRSLLAALYSQPVQAALYFPLLRGWISA